MPSAPHLTPAQRRAATGGALVAGAAAAIWRAQLARDRRAVARDPEHARLFAALEGSPHRVRAGDGTELHAEVFGAEDAPTIVLVHGWMCALEFWSPQIQDLARDHRVVAFDLRGHRRSARPADDDYSITALADDLEAVLETLVPADRRVIVAGHSLGGMTTVAWAQRHPSSRARLAAAALVNTGMGDLVSESLVVRMPTVAGRAQQLIGRAVLAAPAPLPRHSSPVTHRAIRYVALCPDATPAQVAFCEQMILACGPSVRAGFGRTLSKLALHDAVEDLDVPTLVIAGERDRLTPPSLARRLAEALPRPAGLTTLPRVGHMAPVEDADAVIAALRGLADDHLRSAATERPPSGMMRLP